jgi:hypothetical protein
MPLGGCASTYHDSTLASAGTGAAIGAAGGAGVAALAGGDLLTGAVIGAAVGGIAGAVWHDRNNDGRVDGYVAKASTMRALLPAIRPRPILRSAMPLGDRYGADRGRGRCGRRRGDRRSGRRARLPAP